MNSSAAKKTTMACKEIAATLIQSAAAMLRSAIFYVVALYFSGASAIVHAAYLFGGAAPAFLTAGCFLVVSACIIARGVARA